MKQIPLLRSNCGLLIEILCLCLIVAMFATGTAVAQYNNVSVQAPVEPPPAEPPAPAPEETKPYYADRVVYLTFDDGPNPDVTPRILQILKQYNVPATFFVVGTQVVAHPELLRQVQQAGHAIGNHTYTHRYKELYASPAAYIEQLHKCGALIEAVAGVTPLVTRAPGGTTGSFTDAYWSALKREGYKDVGWNISSGDASSAKAAQITANVISQAQKNKFLWSHAIVLMHDGIGHEETAAALPAIIEFFKKEGFEFRVADRTTPPAW